MNKKSNGYVINGNTVTVNDMAGNCIESQVIDQICGMEIGIDLTGDNYRLSPEQEEQFAADFDEQLEKPLEESLEESLKESLKKQLLEKSLENDLVVHTDGKITRVADKLSDLIGGNN
jgi:hypothetical protein